ncbi:MAG: phosphate acyltransferase PlsX [Pseudomonadota bacterium]
MSRHLILSVDAMGGDRGPAPVMGGLVRALKEEPRLQFLLHGDETVLRPLLTRRPQLAACAQIRHAPDKVEMSTQPTEALRSGKQSSMWRALQSVAEGEASVAVSSGNTGALLAMSVLVLRKAPGVHRPAIAIHWPSDHPSGYTTMLDMGADIGANVDNLMQYAVMGAEYARTSLAIEKPRVGLLNIGTEARKGPALLQQAGEQIGAMAQNAEAGFTYVGFVEGTHIPTGDVDVIVTDGFTGNVALKAGEATARFIRNALKDAYRHTWLSRMAYLFALTSMQRLRKRIDPRRVNGGVFLGLGGSVVKSHGDADALGFSTALLLAARLAERNFPEHLASQLAKLDIGDKSSAPASGAERRAE